MMKCEINIASFTLISNLLVTNTPHTHKFTVYAQKLH